MRQTINILIAVLVAGVAVTAQNATTTTDTTVKSDNGTVVTMAGCVMIGGGTSFTLTNITSAQHKHDNATSPAAGSYALMAREGLDLAPYIQQKVELTGVVVPAATKGDKDDKIRVKETTTTAGAAPAADKTSSKATTVKIVRGAGDQLIVASVKVLAPTCE